MGKMITVSAEGSAVPGYLAEPSGLPRGGIIVIHEVWGLVGHIKSVADRFASEGYVALAPDLLGETDIASRVGTLNIDLFNPEKRNDAQPKLRTIMAPIREPGFAEATVAKLKACFAQLCQREDTDRRVGVCGFCFGGSYSYSLAMAEPRLKAAVPFYGHAMTNPDELHLIACPILAFYGERDEELVAGLPELRSAMKVAGVDYEAVVYPGCGHAFFNDTNPYAYNETAAKDAWQRTLTFLADYLL